MGSSKPRILPWLVSILDAGCFEGVAWLDAGRRRFRIPWKHGLRQDAQEQDFSIFRAWAEASGAYTPGKDNPDLPTWKRNFRAALNRKEVVRVVDDLSKDPQDPHKVFEFVIPGGGFPAQEPAPDPGYRGSAPDSQAEVVELLTDLNDLYLAPTPNGKCAYPAEAPQHLPPYLPNPSLDIPAPSPALAPPENPAPPENLAPPENPLRPLLVLEGEWEFEVTAFYRGRQVFQQVVHSQQGLRLLGSAADNPLPGLPVVLPDPERILSDRNVISRVQCILSHLSLVLCRAGQQLWARRLGHCRVFWAMGDEQLPDGSQGHVGEVPKDAEGSVLDLRPFIEDLIAFIQGSSHSPRYTLWFCLGESWRQDQPWTKRLVMVKLVPTCLRALLDMARCGGASSLEGSVDLHISNSEPLCLSSEQYEAYLQDLLEDMDTEPAAGGAGPGPHPS